MKRKKLNKLGVNILIAVCMFVFMFLLLRTDEFTGNLEGYNHFSIIDDSETYDLIKAVNYDTKDVTLALYSTSDKLQYEFYQDGELLTTIEPALYPNDCIVFDFNYIENTEITLKVTTGITVLDELTFMYNDSYTESYYLIGIDMNFNDLLYQDNVESKSVMVELFKSDELNPFIVATIFIGMIIIFFIPYKKIFTFLFTEKLTIILKRVFVHLLMTVVFTGLTLYFIILIFGEDSDITTSLYDNIDYISEETDSLTVDVSMGINEMFIAGEGSTLSVVYRLKLLTNSNDVDYTGIFVCGDSDFGRIASIQKDKFRYEDIMEIYVDDKCINKDTFHIIVIDSKTSMEVYKTQDYKLYQDPNILIETYQLTEDRTGVYFSIGIVVFHFLITASIFDYLLIKDEEKQKRKEEQRLKNQYNK